MISPLLSVNTQKKGRPPQIGAILKIGIDFNHIIPCSVYIYLEPLTILLELLLHDK
ncbi:hypothetical protein GCM10008967_20560 [Bacillus carboniphilus]|uniref:Uncharacterized protein n=1 Tax=Bacillus carboniphilus TaxID=86663 RepID=A0ABP3G1G6_9BACI